MSDNGTWGKRERERKEGRLKNLQQEVLDKTPNPSPVPLLFAQVQLSLSRQLENIATRIPNSEKPRVKKKPLLQLSQRSTAPQKKIIWKEVKWFEMRASLELQSVP